MARVYRAGPSVLNVEGVAEGLVQPDQTVEFEAAHRFGVDKRGGDRDQVVAADNTPIREALGGPDLDLGADTTNRPSDWRARDRSEDCDGSVTGDHADRPSPGRWSQVSPYDVASCYHSGAVSDARREAAETIVGSCGSLR